MQPGRCASGKKLWWDRSRKKKCKKSAKKKKDNNNKNNKKKSRLNVSRKHVFNELMLAEQGQKPKAKIIASGVWSASPGRVSALPGARRCLVALHSTDHLLLRLLLLSNIFVICACFFLSFSSGHTASNSKNPPVGSSGGKPPSIL